MPRHLGLIVGVTLVAAGLATAATGSGAFHSSPDPGQTQSVAPYPASAAGSSAPPASASTSQSSPSATAPAPRGTPARVYVVTRTGTTLINAQLEATKLGKDGVLAPPPGVAGWYDAAGWVLPGRVGTSILVGHVEWSGTPDTFYNLPHAADGDQIIVRYSSGDEVRFTVTAARGKAKSEVPRDRSIWDATATPSLRLITCDPRTPVTGGHFEGNWVVWAVPER